MPVAEKHHTDWFRAHVRPRLFGPLVLFAITVGFFWKLVLTDQYTWLESPDLANQVLPWLQYQAGEWHAGRFPLWAPYEWGGQPLLAQAQPGAAYPPNWLLFLAPLRRGWIRLGVLHWYFVLIHYMAALFCYWLCRDLRRSRPAALLAGVVFAFGGYVGTVDWPQMLNGAVWAPLVFLFLLRAMRGEQATVSAALSGAFLGVAWLAGHHQVPVFLTLAAGFSWLFYIFRDGSPSWSRLRPAAVFVLLMVLVSGLQTVPAYEYGTLARRWAGVDEPLRWNQPVPYLVHQEYSFYPISILGIVVPGLARHFSGFVGVTALSLALLAMALAWRDSAVRFFAALAAGGLLFSLGHNSVLHGVLYALVPLVEKARSPNMAILVFQLGATALVAYGLDELQSAAGSAWLRRVRLALAGTGTLLLILFAILAMARGMGSIADDRPLLTGVIALAVAALLYGWERGNLAWATVATSLLALVLVELGNYSGYALANRHLKGRTEYLEKMAENEDIASFLRLQPQPVRVEVDSKEIPYNFGDWHGVEVWGGYLASITSNLIDIDLGSERTRELIGVTHAIARAPALPDQKLVFRGANGLNVYSNPGAMPRAWTVHAAFPVASYQEMRAFINNKAMNLRQAAAIRGENIELENCSGEDHVRVQRHDANRVILAARMSCRGLVILADTWFPGWTATVDGAPARVYQPYGALRGVIVAGGEHVIEYRYRPRSVLAGAAMTTLGLLAALLLAWRSRRVPSPA